ncbi:MAG: hypothetical protein AAB332_05245 [Planctomycetota bacterium]
MPVCYVPVRLSAGKGCHSNNPAGSRTPHVREFPIERVFGVLEN